MASQNNNYLYAFAAVVLVAALGFWAYNSSDDENNGSSSSPSSVSSSVASSAPAVRSSSASSVAPSGSQSKVLVSQSFKSAHEVTGYDRLVAMHVVKLKGDVSDGSIVVENSHNTAVMVYYAPANEDGTINQEAEYKRFAVLGGTFIGGEGEDCPNQSKDFKMDGVFSLSSFPVSATDRCDTSVHTLDLQRMINGNGAYLGFFPVNSEASLKVTAEYEGELTVTPLVAR